MVAFNSNFQAAIPGQSLTQKMGSLPHQKPPKYVNPNDALEFIWKMLNQKAALKQVWLCLEQGITVWHIRRALLMKLCLEGTIQLTLAMVIGQQVDKMIEAIGKAKGVNIKLNPKFKDNVKDAMINAHINKQLGRQDSTPLPPSALKSAMLPSPEEITRRTTAETGQPQSDKPPQFDNAAGLLHQIQQTKTGGV